jgi:D-sedoheptulose 7-phosphate isomerase
MDRLDERLEKHVELLIQRYPGIKLIKDNIISAYFMMEKCYERNGKLLIAGNGGSASDSEHMAAELMKSFKALRRVNKEFAGRLQYIDEKKGKFLADCLEYALPAIPLVSQGALITAYLNDVGWEGIFAQQILGYGNAGDVFLGVSTSGNSENIINAAITAKAMGIGVIALTGKKGGQLADFADIAVRVPEEETYVIQELHLPIYHCWCLMLEEKYFGKMN